MTAPLPPDVVDGLRSAQDLHFDHYDGDRLPVAVLDGHGLRQRVTALHGPDAGTVREVIDAGGGYASGCLGAAPAVAFGALERGLRAGQATDEVGSHQRALLLHQLFGESGLLTEHFPHGEYHVSGRSSGSEGVELALRLVLESRFDRRSLRPVPSLANRDRVVAFQGAWHGWTGGLVPLLNRRHFTVGLPRGGATSEHGFAVDHLPFGDQGALDDYFERMGERVLAVVVEPVQGDAGVLVPPAGYLRAVADRARAHGALLVADEVLTFAKTGRFLAMSDARGPIPTDITVIGKGLGLGVVPVSMVIARRGLRSRPSGAVSTNDLRPLTCAVVSAGLAHIHREGLLVASAQVGEHLGELVRDRVVARFAEVYHEERGVGLLRGVELTERGAEDIPGLRGQLIRAGVHVEFMSGAGRRSHGRRYVFPTLRITPPLITTPADAEDIVAGIAEGTAAWLRTRR